MALVSCHECGSKVSTKADRCPQCGAKPKPRTKTSTKIIAGLFGFVILASIIAQNSNTASTTMASSKKEVDPLIEKRFQTTVMVAKSVKASLRNPDSVVWSGILANDDASVVCIEYRAQNGFGGMNLGQIAYVKGKLQTSAAVWNKNCADKQMNNMKNIKYAL